MSSNTYTAPIRHISEVESIPYGDGKTFEKRTLVLEDDDKYNDCIVFELGGAKMDIVNGYKPGDVVTVSYNISCRENKKKAGNFFTSLRAWKVEAPAAKTPGGDEPPPVDEDSIPF